MADGFAWNGQTYDSLSKVAFAITGTKWKPRADAGHVFRPTGQPARFLQRRAELNSAASAVDDVDLGAQQVLRLSGQVSAPAARLRALEL